MRYRLPLILKAAVMVLAGLVWPVSLPAQDEAPAASEAAPPAEPAADTPTAAEREAAGAAESRRAGTEDEIVLTEEAEPDKQVIFLVDI